jgi:T5SS/PEP-CTERM-associated repeat protein/autotransporter-associated beta strand protein
MKSSQNQKTFNAIGLALVTIFLLIILASPIQAAITSTGSINPTDPNFWISTTNGYIGYSSTGTVTVDDASSLLSKSCYLGYNSGTDGTATVTGAGSKWTNSDTLFIGYSGIGTLKIESGGEVSNSTVWLGEYSGSSGTATVTGPGSIWTNSGGFFLGNWGPGTMNVEAGGQVSNTYCLLGGGPATSTVNVTGAGSKWINSSTLEVGATGVGVLNIKDGGEVSDLDCYIGRYSGSHGTATVTGSSSKWTHSRTLYVGRSGEGILNIEAGGQVSADDSILGNGIATVTGEGSIWTNTHGISVGIGGEGNGELIIKEGGQVAGGGGAIALSGGSTGSVTVIGPGAKWNTKAITVGYYGAGSLVIKSGGQVSNGNGNGQLGYETGSSGTAMVTGAGSSWINNGELYIARLGNGTLKIEAGGLVNSTVGYLGYGVGSNGTVTVTGSSSTWINSDAINVGYTRGTLNIGSGIASEGTVFTKSLSLAKVLNSSEATCNLNGGTLQTASITKGIGTATFNWSDGTIRNLDSSTDLIVSGENSLRLQLAATGTHAFYIDADRTGTVAAVLSDATNRGTLEKQGDGLLTLSGKNVYKGSTTIAAGTLALSSTGSLASSPIDVKSGATFDVSAKNGYSVALGKTLTGSGTIVGDLSISGIHAPGNSTGVETVKGNYSLLGELQIELAGTTAGTGYGEVLISGSNAYNAALTGTLSLDWTNFNGSTDSTQLWIVKNDTAGTLSGAFSNYVSGASLGLHDGRSWYLYYNADAATGNLTGGNDVLIAPVPEPATIVLLGIALLAAIAWRRKSRVGQA